MIGLKDVFPGPQDEWDKKRRASQGHQDYMAGIRRRGNNAPPVEPTNSQALGDVASSYGKTAAMAVANKLTPLLGDDPKTPKAIADYVKGGTGTALAATEPSIDAAAGVPDNKALSIDNTGSNASLKLSNKGIEESYPGQLKAFQLNSEIDNMKYPLGSAGDGRERNPDGSLRVGNMDVAFGPGVTKEQAAAFLRDPSAPAPEYRSIQSSFGGGRDSRAATAGGPPALLTADNTQGIGWKQRKALNEINLHDYNLGKMNTQNNLTDLRQVEMAGLAGIDKANAAGRAASQADAREFIQDLVLKGVPVDEAMQRAYATGSNLDITGLSVPGAGSKDKLQPKWIDKQFDKKNRLIEGTGVWEIPDAWEPDFSRNFDPNDSSTWTLGDYGHIEMLSNAKKTGMLEKIKQQYGK